MKGIFDEALEARELKLPSERDRAIFSAARTSGRTQQELAKEHGLTQGRISQIIRSVALWRAYTESVGEDGLQPAQARLLERSLDRERIEVVYNHSIRSFLKSCNPTVFRRGFNAKGEEWSEETVRDEGGNIQCLKLAAKMIDQRWKLEDRTPPPTVERMAHATRTELAKALWRMRLDSQLLGIMPKAADAEKVVDDALDALLGDAKRMKEALAKQAKKDLEDRVGRFHEAEEANNVNIISGLERRGWIDPETGLGHLIVAPRCCSDEDFEVIAREYVRQEAEKKAGNSNAAVPGEGPADEKSRARSKRSSGDDDAPASDALPCEQATDETRISTDGGIAKSLPVGRSTAPSHEVSGELDAAARAHFQAGDVRGAAEAGASGQCIPREDPRNESDKRSGGEDDAAVEAMPVVPAAVEGDSAPPPLTSCAAPLVQPPGRATRPTMALRPGQPAARS
jgi:hypothetical protein